MTNLPCGLPVDFLTRSWLLIPPIEEAAMHAGYASGVDVLVFDLAAIEAQDRRAAAEGVAALIRERGERQGDPAVFIGLPALDAMTESLLAEVVPVKPQGIMLMEVARPADLQQLDVMLSAEEAVLELEDGLTRVAILLSQALGISFAGLSRRLVALGWSASALQKLTHARRMHDGAGLLTDLFRQARASVVVAAADAHVESLDTPSGLFSSERLARDCREAAADGFTGKLTLSPRQVTAINHAFLPNVEEIGEAASVLASLGQASGAERLRALKIIQRSTPTKG